MSLPSSELYTTKEVGEIEREQVKQLREIKVLLKALSSDCQLEKHELQSAIFDVTEKIEVMIGKVQTFKFLAKKVSD